MKRSQGYRAKTRSLLSKPPRERGKPRIRKLLQNYQLGDKVVVKIDSSMHRGMPHRRFHGKIGVVTGKRGRAYTVNVTQGNALKEIIVRPEHLEPYTGITNG